MKELDKQARAVGAKLQSLGKIGERALLVYPPGLEFIAAYPGCLYSGLIAVPPGLNPQGYCVNMGWYRSAGYVENHSQRTHLVVQSEFLFLPNLINQTRRLKVAITLSASRR